MLRMIVPSLINAFFGVLGMLATLSWRAAPAALVFEQLGAREAVKHGRALVKPVRGQLADALVPLWLIGWLIAGAPMLGGLWLLGLLVPLSPSAVEALMLIGWIVGSAFVAPLMVLGAIQFYLFVRDRSTQSMETSISALYSGVSATGPHPPTPSPAAAGEGEVI
jgi:hypothetical protein